MRIRSLAYVAAVGLILASCSKPQPAKKVAADPCDSAKAQPPFLTQEQAVKTCKDNEKFVGAPTKRSNVQITNH